MHLIKKNQRLIVDRSARERMREHQRTAKAPERLWGNTREQQRRQREHEGTPEDSRGAKERMKVYIVSLQSSPHDRKTLAQANIDYLFPYPRLMSELLGPAKEDSYNASSEFTA